MLRGEKFWTAGESWELHEDFLLTYPDTARCLLDIKDDQCYETWLRDFIDSCTDEKGACWFIEKYGLPCDVGSLEDIEGAGTPDRFSVGRLLAAAASLRFLRDLVLMLKSDDAGSVGDYRKDKHAGTVTLTDFAPVPVTPDQKRKYAHFQGYFSTGGYNEGLSGRHYRFLVENNVPLRLDAPLPDVHAAHLFIGHVLEGIVHFVSPYLSVQDAGNDVRAVLGWRIRCPWEAMGIALLKEITTTSRITFCKSCGKPIQGRADRIFCESDACRKRYNRKYGKTRRNYQKRG